MVLLAERELKLTEIIEVVSPSAAEAVANHRRHLMRRQSSALAIPFARRQSPRLMQRWSRPLEDPGPFVNVVQHTRDLRGCFGSRPLDAAKRNIPVHRHAPWTTERYGGRSETSGRKPTTRFSYTPDGMAWRCDPNVKPAYFPDVFRTTKTIVS